jgi:hypothetical protein
MLPVTAPPAPATHRWILLLSLLFLSATGGAWAWYHVAPKQFAVSYHFDATNTVAGWQFRPEPVPENAVEILATTNLFNGTFFNERGERITVFMGTWDADNPKQLSVVGHTPDVCWVGAGWKPVRTEHPAKLPLTFGPHQIPFEARTFLTPDGRQRELTVWCTVVSGQVFEETARFEVAPTDAGANRKQLQAEGARSTLKSKLVKAIGERIPGSGTKQFVRFSTATGTAWQAPFASLQRFGEHWLHLQALVPGQHPAP